MHVCIVYIYMCVANVRVCCSIRFSLSNVYFCLSLFYLIAFRFILFSVLSISVALARWHIICIAFCVILLHSWFDTISAWYFRWFGVQLLGKIFIFEYFTVTISFLFFLFYFCLFVSVFILSVCFCFVTYSMLILHGVFSIYSLNLKWPQAVCMSVKECRRFDASHKM